MARLERRAVNWVPSRPCRSPFKDNRKRNFLGCIRIGGVWTEGSPSHSQTLLCHPASSAAALGGFLLCSTIFIASSSSSISTSIDWVVPSWTTLSPRLLLASTPAPASAFSKEVCRCFNLAWALSDGGCLSQRHNNACLPSHLVTF